MSTPHKPKVDLAALAEQYQVKHPRDEVGEAAKDAKVAKARRKKRLRLFPAKNPTTEDRR